MSVITWVWMGVAPLWAGLRRVARRPADRTLVAHVVAGVLFPVTLVAGLFVAGRVFPPGQ